MIQSTLLGGKELREHAMEQIKPKTETKNQHQQMYVNNSPHQNTFHVCTHNQCVQISTAAMQSHAVL